MRKLVAWLGAATLAVVCSAVQRAEAGSTSDPLKPYVVLVLDTSGSMQDATGTGSPSCGGPDTKLNHARCAINKIVNTYGEMVFAFGRFRSVSGGTTTAATFPSGCTVAGPDDTGGITCDASDDMFELFTPLVDGQNSSTAVWTNGTGNTCTATGTDPEVWEATGNTPLEGVLNGAKDYWVGKQETDYTVWPSGSAGFSPIFNDPTKNVFLPAGCDPSPTCTTNCCATQCRPYITILLTDGAETCGGHAANAGTGADALYKSDVGACKNNTAIQCTANAQCTTGTGDSCVLKRYHVITKPIGFGIADPNTALENIAHAGGTPDTAGDQAYYATNEAGLELAFSQILAGAVRTEVCNGVDDDCDTKVDEGFNKGAACNNGLLGACFRTGTTVCSADGTGVTCNAPTATGTAEICNGIDDDCDGKVDEGVAGCNCVVQGETCNNKDDDCDGKTDEGITRACGTGVCQGVETCTSGVFGGCTAKTPTTEVCNGKDDDCDGVIDGITQECSAMAGTHPAGDPANNPGGDPMSACFAEGPSICVCHPGEQSCPAGGTGAVGACTGEVKPGTEICNGLDDDCDGKVDEGTGGQDCSTDCGIGTTVCTAGVITCNGTTATTDDTCDGHDDDCDGRIDEDYMSPGACGAGVVCNGMEKCINGTPTCVGDPIQPDESCNCADDDCDGKVDENAACPSGSTCSNCQCAFPCATGEFPCPLGKYCSADNFCIADPCYQKDCPPVGGHRQECQVQGNAGVCVDSCRMGTGPGDNCADPNKCKYETGECLPNNCTSFPDLCTGDQVCINNVCTSNPCAGVTCQNGQYCVGVNGTGTCVDSCAGKECDTGTRCQLGQCVPDPCGKPCPGHQVCEDSTGTCHDDPCPEFCPTGESCDPHGDGTCTQDPCVGTTCPDPSQVCSRGTCDNPPVLTPDGEPEQHVTTGGGGGCSTGGDGSLVLGLGLALLVARKRRKELEAASSEEVAS